MCIRVETDCKEASDEADRLEAVARILSGGVYAYLKKKGLLAAHGPPVAEKDAPAGHEPEGGDSR